MNERINGNSWIPLIVVACASFIIVLDTFFMNVSISRIVVDLNTDVSTIQMIMSFYTLITAALILVGTKLQDIIGKKKLFLIGVALFGIGAFTAAISTSTIMFFVGWSGIGLVLLEVYDNFQKLDTVDGQNCVVVNTADIIIQNAMASVMHALAIVLGVILILTLRIKNKNIKKVR